MSTFTDVEDDLHGVVPKLYRQIFQPDQVLDDPYPLLRRIGDAGPVHRVGPGLWLATSWDACLTVLRSTHFVIDAEAVGRARGGERWREHPALVLLSRTLLVSNPPEHTHLRGAVAGAFTAERVRAMTASITAVTDRLLDELPPYGPVDLIPQFADRLPLEVIKPVLGIEDWPFGDFRVQTMNFNLVLERELTGNNLARADEAAEQIAQCLGILIAQRRREPCDDVISRLVQACAAGHLAEEDIVPLVFQLFNASYQTTASMLGSALDALLVADRWAQLGSNPGLVDSAVQEVLRTDPPVQSTGRNCSRATRLVGREIAANDFVVAVLATANRDPRRYDDPDAFHLRRRRVATLSFGRGIHHCLGAGLATLEATVALSQLTQRFPTMARAGAARRWPTANLRSFASFPVWLRGEQVVQS